MSQSIEQERAKMLQDVCGDTTTLQHTKDIVSRNSVVMDSRGNLFLREAMNGDGTKMLYRKHLVLGTGNWPQHSLEEANRIINNVPQSYTEEEEIERFITNQCDM
jgi:hypothetical protein